MGWISIDERMPPDFVSVLVCAPELAPLPTVHEAYAAKGKWFSPTVYGIEDVTVTHWMEMPEPPKE